MQFPITLILPFLLFLGIFYKSEARTPKLCNIAYDCTNEENPVWATTNGQFCEVFRNECIRLSENCNRVNTNRPEAKRISRRKCQELCRSQVCLTVYTPVCGIYNNKKRTFGNDCEMSRYICKTGQTFSLYKRGACEKGRLE
ncbi:U-Kazal-Dg21.2-like [Eupeodes corollae]|uniref:U-Kazal-Dg21.2-like n=1 Tax=Eupeodes corollae TaxID=290404 RepID=UPI00248FB243|nr:U-Kazal-Dg21.2-like [Eupeodes corollae]